MKSFSVMSLGIFVAVLAACATDGLPREEETAEEHPQGVSQREFTALLAPEPGAAAMEYEARTSRYRLFGVQLNQVPAESFATLADTSTWETRDLHVGELLGRNLRVAAITPEGLHLTGAGGVMVLRVGQDVSLRVIHHRFDLATTYLGRLRSRVKASVVTRLRGRYGLGAEEDAVTVFSRHALRLIHLQEDGAMARLGFREGDLIFSVNGKPLAPGDLDALVDQLVAPGSTVHVTVFREASLQELTFFVEG